MERTRLHILGGSSRSRAEQARIAFALGHHAEIYGSIEELLEHPPEEGIVLAADGELPGGVPALIRRLGEAGIWLPLVMTDEECRTDRVVDAIHGGALDYLPLPLEIGSFARRLHRILAEAAPQMEARRRELEARRQIGALSRRERQVLECLAAGRSNKVIARDLGISPRTVEIHRANMMTKLAASHPADALRVWMDAHLGPSEIPGGSSAAGSAKIERIGHRPGEEHSGPEARPRRAQRQ